jgi:hypothetical protein
MDIVMDNGFARHEAGWHGGMIDFEGQIFVAQQSSPKESPRFGDYKCGENGGNLLAGRMYPYYYRKAMAGGPAGLRATRYHTRRRVHKQPHNKSCLGSYGGGGDIISCMDLPA